MVHVSVSRSVDRVFEIKLWTCVLLNRSMIWALLYTAVFLLSRVNWVVCNVIKCMLLTQQINQCAVDMLQASSINPVQQTQLLMDVVKQSEDHGMWTDIAPSLVPALLEGLLSSHTKAWSIKTVKQLSMLLEIGMVSGSQFGTDVRIKFRLTARFVFAHEKMLSLGITAMPSPCYPCRHRKFLNAITALCTAIALFLEVVSKWFTSGRKMFKFQTLNVLPQLFKKFNHAMWPIPDVSSH